MSALRAEEVYKRHIKPLSPQERLRILEMIGHDLAESVGEMEKQQKRNIMDLHGLGKEMWEGVDAQSYVDEQRAEWDHRP
ncbi:MAG: hypothetical protein M1133_13575 [Armatimonadetes bacterium]|nr:hypothetical protein [Armatimonadota bacterium]